MFDDDNLYPIASRAYTNKRKYRRSPYFDFEVGLDSNFFRQQLENMTFFPFVMITIFEVTFSMVGA